MDLPDLLDILDEECSLVVEALRRRPEADLGRQTRCSAWDVRGLVGHLWCDVDRLATCLELEPESGPTCDATTYFRAYDPVTDAPSVAEQGRAVAARYPTGADVVGAFDQHRAACIGAVRTLPGDRVVRTRIATMRLAELVKTRVLELSVHGLDLADALDAAPWLTRGGEAITLGILEGLLGGPPSLLLAEDPVGFIDKGTGRAELTDRDRAALGELAERFPLLG